MPYGSLTFMLLLAPHAQVKRLGLSMTESYAMQSRAIDLLPYLVPYREHMPQSFPIDHVGNIAYTHAFNSVLCT